MAFRDLLFKPEPDAAPETPAPSAPSLLAARLRAVTAPTHIAVAEEPRAPVIPSAPDAEFTRELLEQLAKATKPGFRELSEQMDLLASAIPDEMARLKAAAASVRAFLKLTPQQMADAVDEQVAILTRANQEFKTGLSAEAEQRTTSFSAHLRDVENKLAQNDRERQELTADRTTTTAQLAQIQVDTASVSARFTSAFHPLHESLTAIAGRLRTGA